MNTEGASLRRAVIAVALLNLAYFGVEFAVAVRIGSVSLFADSIDFLEDTSINLLIALAVGWSAARRSRVGMTLALIILVPGLATLWTAWQKFMEPVAPAPIPLTLTGLGALAVNLAAALLLVRFRHAKGSLTKAAFLSARNDALANIAIVATGFVTAATRSAWPDIVVGLAIAAMNADAAREVWEAAREEHRDAQA
jgi:Co/Zn/Cd efflux system component